MLLKVLGRAALLFLALVAIAATATGALLRHHVRIAGPCPRDRLLDGEPVACAHWTQPMVDAPSLAALAAAGVAVCLLVAWSSLRRTGKA